MVEITNEDGSAENVLYVASPIYKQRFNLVTGQCLDDENIILDTYKVELEGSDVIVKYN
jgi:nitrite reductase (NADH) small subunit